MSDLPASRTLVQLEASRFRSAVSEALIQTIGGGLNALLSEVMNVQTFTSSGSFVVPANVDWLYVECCGGGGGGGATDNPYATTNGSSGGGGSRAIGKIVLVTPGDTHSVTVGAGGAGAVADTSLAGAGGTSSFGSLHQALGGLGGNSYGNANDQSQRTGYGTGGHGGTPGQAGGPDVYAGGTSNSAAGGVLYGGGGGGGAGGAGGNGGQPVFGAAGNGSSAAANSGAGGGAGGAAASRTGGAGGSGFVKVYWIIDP